jgi:catechol-2,3-dioxygenase
MKDKERNCIVPITRLNHAVLYVRNLERTLSFWCGLLDFVVVHEIPEQGAFLRAPLSHNDHDLAFFALGDTLGGDTAGRSTVGLYHLAFEVDTLKELQRLAGVMSKNRFLVGASDHATTKSLYVADPDGIEIELCWIVPADLLDPETLSNQATTTRLDLEVELARYGPETLGGVGISLPR